MNFSGKAKNILSAVLDCLFPRCCTICGKRVDVKEYCNLCSFCAARIPWLRGPRCRLCSRSMGSVPLFGDEGLLCDKCKSSMPCFKSYMACWSHNGIGRSIVLALKYGSADFLKNDIVALLENNCSEVCQFASNSVLVPVPMHYFRRVGRGYNQAEVICEAILKIANESTIVSMLTSRRKKSQTKLAGRDRLLNIKNVFECSSVGVAKNSRIVLVDDVFTTGATARECCHVLHDAGFDDLHVLTLSHG
ncbi:MAG: double zinc ribbon domain-containing protein [Puniceicoccales bacterium]|jgi:ComF family protein|nr:double zinc ribbon domain-containing protein [Puniceicoccales bacterium]